MSRRRTSQLLVLAAVVGALSASSSAARAADPQEQQLAQALFDEGRRLMDGKRYGDACPKLAESQRLDPGGGTLLNLAICHEKEGKLATARSDFDEALSLATRDGRKDRQKIARERIAAIDAVIPRVTVIVAPAADIDGLEVKLDGLVLRRAAWGVATAVDPGSHVVEATATGRAPWSSTVQVDAGQKRNVDVPVLGPLAPLPLGGVAAAPHATAGEGGLGLQRPMIVTEGPGQGQGAPDAQVFGVMPAERGKPNPVYYAVLTTTLVSAGAAAVTGIVAFTADKDAKEGCLPDRKYCRDQESSDAADRASTMAWLSTVTLGVAAAGFIALLVIPSRTAAPASPLRGSASIVPGGGSLGLSGSF
jgi:hypothetical protein